MKVNDENYNGREMPIVRKKICALHLWAFILGRLTNNIVVGTPYFSVPHCLESLRGLRAYLGVVWRAKTAF